MLLAFPLILLFQNCGATGGSGDGDDSESAASQSYRNHSSSNVRGAGGSNPSTSGSGGGFSSGNGTFTYGGGSTGSGGSSSGGGTSGGTSGGTGGGGSGGGGTSTYDGKTCFAGVYGLDSMLVRNFNTNDRDQLRILREYAFFDQITQVALPATQLDFPQARSGGTYSVSCEVTKSKLKNFFPSAYFTSQYVELNNTGNVTAFQCRGGFWYFAGTSCRWMHISEYNRQINGGNDR